MNHKTPSLAGMGFPGLYVQGPGAIGQLKQLLSEGLHAHSATLIYDHALEKYLSHFHASGVAVHALPFPGECSADVIAGLVAQARERATDCVIGFGAGKTLDTAKGVAADLGRPIVVMPSAASSDAPTSRLVALYEGHAFKYSRVLPRNPDVVIVDTAILAQAPIRLLVAGIGDALSKRFEVEQAIFSAVPNTYGMGSLKMSLLLAGQCHELLMEHAAGGLDECRKGIAGTHFESLVEACVLYSGLGFEGGGLSLAHGMLRGLTAIQGTENHLHGELVAYGSLVQTLACERQRPHFEALLRFVQQVGLPMSLRDIGARDITESMLRVAAQLTLKAPYLSNGVQGFDEDGIVEAMMKLEELSASP